MHQNIIVRRRSGRLGTVCKAWAAELSIRSRSVSRTYLKLRQFYPRKTLATSLPEPFGWPLFVDTDLTVASGPRCCKPVHITRKSEYAAVRPPSAADCRLIRFA